MFMFPLKYLANKGLTLVALNLFKGMCKNVFILSILYLLHGILERIYRVFNTMAADALATKVGRSSPVMVLTIFTWNIPF